MINSNEIYRHMIEEIEDYAILLLDTKGIVMNWNKGAEKIKGYTAKEILGKNFSLFYTKEDREKKLPEKLIEKAATEGKASDEGWRMKKDGTCFWGNILITAIHDENDKVIGFTKITHDLTEKRSAEKTGKALGQAKKDFLKIFDASPSGMVITDTESRKMVQVNKIFLETFGYDRPEVIGSTADELKIVTNESRQKLAAKIKEQGYLKNENVTCITRSGQEMNCIVSTDLIEMDGKQYFLSLYHDITERLKAAETEKALVQTREGFMKLFNASPSGMIIADIEAARLIEVNESFLATFGYNRKEVIGLTADEIGFVSAETQLKSFSKLKQQGYLSNEDVPCRTKDGKEVDTIFSVEVFEMEGKTCFLCIFHDISYIKEMERSIIENDEKFQKAFHASAAGISITRLSDSTYMEINNAFIEMTGYSKEELIGHTSAELGLITNIEKRSEVLKLVREQGSAKHYEFTIRNKSGKILNVLVSIETILLKGEKYAINIIYNITERKIAEEQLVFANKELEAFSYSVSHDLRAPLRGIHGHTKILKEDYGDKLDDDGKNIIESILRNSKMMGDLIDDLLAFARLGRKEIKRGDIQMDFLVKHITDEFLLSYPPDKIEIKIAPLPPASGDQALIKQVWVNLISNAVKYSQKKSKAIVEIGSYTSEDKNVYYIKDNGAGFDMQYYDKLFGVFQRLHSQAEFDGTGVGLAITQRIIEKHNGKIWAESSVNEGATFHFSL